MQYLVNAHKRGLEIKPIMADRSVVNFALFKGKEVVRGFRWPIEKKYQKAMKNFKP